MVSSEGANTSEPIHIKRGILQGDSLSPLRFCMALNPLSWLLNDARGHGFALNYGLRVKCGLRHLMYLDYINLYAGTDDLQKIHARVGDLNDALPSEFLRRINLVLKLHLSGKNKISALNAVELMNLHKASDESLGELNLVFAMPSDSQIPIHLFGRRYDVILKQREKEPEECESGYNGVFYTDGSKTENYFGAGVYLSNKN